MSEQPPAYKPGDVVNGHVLTSENTWVPLSQPPPQTQVPAGYSYPHPGSSQPVVVVQTDSNNTSLAPVTSLVTGLIGLFFCWIPIIGIVSWVFAPLAVIFGILGLQRGKAEHKIMSWIGIVCGALALVVCVLYVVAFAGAFSSDSDFNFDS